MKTYCKNADPSDLSTIKRFAWEAIQAKIKRRDYSEFVSRYCTLSAKEIRKRYHEGYAMFPELDRALDCIALDISLRIRNRQLNLEPIHYSERTDGLSKKTRVIGIESVMQQLMEHVAVGCMTELWEAKYEDHQYASIKGRGQLKGVKQIQKWTKAGKTRYFVKLDVRKCFQSLNRETAMKWLQRDIGKNKLLLWFVDALLQLHQDGLVIGSLLSQFLCNYFMSYAYRFVMGLHKERRGKLIKLCTCALFYMDDILLCGNDRRNLLMAVRKLIKYMKASFGLTIKPGWDIRRHELCGIDMMGYVVTAKGKIKVRGRVFLKARRAFVRSLKGDERLKTQRRISAYYGFFKAAKIKKLETLEGFFVYVKQLQNRASQIISADAKKEVLRCAA